MLYNSCVYLPVCWSIWVVLYIQVTWHEGKLIWHYLYFQKNSNVAAWTAMINSTRGLKMENSFSEHLTCKREAWQVTTQLAFHSIILGFSCGSAGKKICLECRRPRFDPWVGKIPWRRERLPTPAFWPGEFHGLYSPWDHRGSNTMEPLSLSIILPMKTSKILSILHVFFFLKYNICILLNWTHTLKKKVLAIAQRFEN